MIVLRCLLSFFFWAYAQIGLVFIALVSFPARLLPEHGRTFCYWLTRWLIRLAFFVCGFRVRVSGQKNLLANGGRVVIANKPDMISTFALIAYFPERINFAADAALFSKLFLGWIMSAIGCLAVGGEKHSVLSFVSAVKHRLQKGEVVLLYPQNLRRFDRRVGAFQGNEIRLIDLLHANLIPVAVKGTDRIMPGGAILSPGKIGIAIGLRPENLEAWFRKELERE
jgi:1-acyl-sn-glycerol-3-phosphate acyltransferase